MNKENDALLQQFTGILRQEKSKLLRYACYKLGNKQDAEDALQDIYLRLYAYLHRQHSEVRISNLRCYLFRLLSHYCTDKLACLSRYQTIPIEKFTHLLENENDNQNEEYQRIVNLLEEIPLEQAEVIRLRIYAEKSFAEIADILDLPLPTVKSRFLYGLNKLRFKIHIHK